MKKFFCSRPSPSSTDQQPIAKSYALGNYQQTTKIIQEFNIQQSTNTSDITVSSTINIKSTAKPTLKSCNGDLLSEADFQRVVQDITPADRDLFDEFLNGIKQKTDDYLFLSTLDDLPPPIESTGLSQRQSSVSYSPSPSSMASNDYRRARNALPRGSNTIHYGAQTVRPSSNTTVAAQTLKQMAVQHQQRIIYNQQQSNTYTNYSSTENFPAHYYQTSSTIPDTPPSIEQVSQMVMARKNDQSRFDLFMFDVFQTSHYSGGMSYSSVPSTNFSPYSSSNIYTMNNYSYQTSTPVSSSYYPVNPGGGGGRGRVGTTASTNCPSTNLPPSSNSNSYNTHDDYLSLLDL